MYEGFILDLLLTAAINIIPAVAVLLINGPIFDKSKAVKTCVAIGVLALLIIIFLFEIADSDGVPKIAPEVFYGYLNFLILHKIPLNRSFKKMNIHLSDDPSSDAQDNIANTRHKKAKKVNPLLLVLSLLLLLTNIFWFVSYNNLQDKLSECETKVKSLEMYVDSLTGQLSNAREDAEEYTEFEKSLDESREQRKKERAEEIAEWNKNNPDQPLDPETGQPL